MTVGPGWRVLAVAVLAVAVRAQDVPPPAVPPAAVAPAGEPAAPPDPSRWLLDPEGRHRAWLDQPTIDPADVIARPEAYAEVLASHGLALDREGRTLAVRGAALHDQSTLGYPIEYLVVNERGRTYEAVILVRAMPSIVDACLQALGLVPGSPTTFTEKDPPPSDAELEAGASAWTMTSAGGPLLSIDVQWTDGDGKPRGASLESMLVELRPDAEPRPLAELGWVYCGSTFGRYRQGRDMLRWHRGDVEGDLVAIYLDGRQSCLLERNSPDGVDGGLYTLNADVAPPPGTPVTLLLRPRGEERVAARAVSLDRAPDALAGDPGGGR